MTTITRIAMVSEFIHLLIHRVALQQAQAQYAEMERTVSASIEVEPVLIMAALQGGCDATQ